jgi:SNF2 family DNA or RNA helicase
MGLGKTVEALAWIALAKFPGIIVVPTSVQMQWKSQTVNLIQAQPLLGEVRMIT